MRQKMIWMFLLCIIVAGVRVKAVPDIRIEGLVKNPLNLTLKKLTEFPGVTVRLNEVTMDSRFRGVFDYRGVPLRTLLELASIQKEKTASFSKPVDLAVVVHNRAGRQVVISWGEIFYRNQSGVILAISAYPIIPHKECKRCHTPEVFESWLGQLHRTIRFPKLVIADDFFSDRCLEDVTRIEVMDVCPQLEVKRLSRLFSPGFTVEGAVKNRLAIHDLSEYQRRSALVKLVGEGKGYHGLKRVDGVVLSDILKKADITQDINTVFLVSSPDGYRSLLSYGEVFLSPSGEHIVIVDTINTEPLKQNGKTILIIPDDFAADRWVKAVSKIDVIRLKRDRRR